MANNAHLSLFSGIGGLDLAAEWAGFRTVAFVERDKYCQRVLAKHWPGVPIFGDVAELGYASFMQRDGGEYHAGCHCEGDGEIPEIPESRDANRSPVILSGGFPCQPHSVAGKRKASLDERDLWGECARITAEFRPRWAVFENVPGLLSSERGTFFARVLGDLAALGYRVGWGVWGANDVGALHRRDRVFIVAHAGCDGGESERVAGIGCGSQGSMQGKGEQRERVWAEFANGREDVADANGQGSQGRDELEWAGRHSWTGRKPIEGIWRIEPQVGRVANGVPKRVDRLRALGNAVVPQQAYPIFKAIAEIEGINA